MSERDTGLSGILVVMFLPSVCIFVKRPHLNMFACSNSAAVWPHLHTMPVPKCPHCPFGEDLACLVTAGLRDKWQEARGSYVVLAQRSASLLAPLRNASHFHQPGQPYAMGPGEPSKRLAFLCIPHVCCHNAQAIPCIPSLLARIIRYLSLQKVITVYRELLQRCDSIHTVYTKTQAFFMGQGSPMSWVRANPPKGLRFCVFVFTVCVCCLNAQAIPCIP